MKCLSDAFLDYLIAGMHQSTVFLINGIKLSGILTCHDKETLTLSRDGATQLVFKQAIATVMPIEAMNLFDVVGDMENVK